MPQPLARQAAEGCRAGSQCDRRVPQAIVYHSSLLSLPTPLPVNPCSGFTTLQAGYRRDFPFSANIATCCKRKLDRTGRSGSPGPFALDRTIDGVDQHLGLDEFDPGPLGLLAIEGCRQGFGEGVAVIGHSFARFSQCLKSLAHIGSAFCWPRDLGWRETQLARVTTGLAGRMSPAAGYRRRVTNLLAQTMAP